MGIGSVHGFIIGLGTTNGLGILGFSFGLSGELGFFIGTMTGSGDISKL